MRRLSILVLAAAALVVAQDADRDRYAREYVQFLTIQLDQWTKGFPHEYNLSLVKPPVEASKMTEAAKAGANDLRDAVTRLHTLSAAADVAKNAGFRSQLEKTLATAGQVNQAMGAQRFSAVLQADWSQIRDALNGLARIYQLPQLAVLDPPGGGRGGRGAPTTATSAPVPGGIVGYIVDRRCSASGRAMWANAECVKRCVRDGDQVVLVTEEGKVLVIANQDKIDSDFYGVKVTVVGKTEGERITVESLK
jgi:hypothetical protein